MFAGRDELRGELGNVRIFDLTNYPHTIHPKHLNDISNLIPNEIFGLRDREQRSTLNFSCVILSKPDEDIPDASSRSFAQHEPPPRLRIDVSVASVRI